MEQIERLALGHVVVRVEDLQFGHQATALQRKRRTGAHTSAAADDGDFHRFSFLRAKLYFICASN